MCEVQTRNRADDGGLATPSQRSHYTGACNRPFRDAGATLWYTWLAHVAMHGADQR
jgi:hypothetical protein